MTYLVRFIHVHQTFRQPELEALAEINGVKIRWISYNVDNPFGLLEIEGTNDPDMTARALVARCILCYAIYELWGQGHDYESLHTDVTRQTQHRWPDYSKQSFKFELDSFHGSRTPDEQRAIIESFSYMAFEGRIVMKKPENLFTVFEDSTLNAKKPHRLLLGRLVGSSDRKVTATYNLKKRKYISTTSMDAELSLVTANLALSQPGKLVYDPFMGTGSFPLACAQFGATVFGSDMDGRSIRGKKGRNVSANFDQYGTSSLYLDGFIADLTNTPLRPRRAIDAIICDPPYGVREGLKVLGSNKPELQKEVVLNDGTIAHLQADYVPPRKPYSFFRMLDDILHFGYENLSDDGRLCMWMPVAGLVQDDPALIEKPAMLGDMGSDTQDEKEEQEYAIPQHPGLDLVSACQQDFNKWSRRLLTYRRKKDEHVDQAAMSDYQAQRVELQQSSEMMIGHRIKADELNSFRRKYFQGFI